MRCKVGDLAIVINDWENSGNNGALVNVVRRASRDDYKLAPVDWECTAVSTVVLQGEIFQSGEGWFGYRDSELRPIGNPGPEEVDEISRVKEKEQQ